MKKLKLILFLIPVTVLTFAFKPKLTETDLLKSIASKLHSFYSGNPQGKIYIHQDKSMYSVGETMWLKAYLTLNPGLHLDTLNKIVHIDLIAPNNQVIYNRKLKVTDGTASGDIFLPDTLAEGNYQLRAYTSWMRNFSHDYFFTREVRITKTTSTGLKAGISFETRQHSNGDSVSAILHFYKLPFEPVKKLPFSFQLEIDGRKQQKERLQTNEKGEAVLVLNLENQKGKSVEQAVLHVNSEIDGVKFNETYQLPIGQKNLNLQFFPEGGYLVEGLTSRVAFKAVDITGKGADVAGTVYDNLGNKLADFNSEHLGMGLLVLKPEEGKSYEARVKNKDGSTTVFPIGKPRKEGAVLSLIKLKKDLIRLALVNNMSSATTDSSYIVAHAGGNVFYAARTHPGKNGVATNIPTDRFPAGLICFTVFDKAGKPLAERLAFVRRPEALNIAVSTNKQLYGQREKVHMQVRVQDADGNPVAGNFSLAVRDVLSDPDPAPFRESIYTYTFLSSELKGNIEQPAYYFDDNNPLAEQHLDLLLMTQGWRRFTWEDILQDRNPAYQHPIEQSISISGVVEREFNKKKATGIIDLSLVFKKENLEQEEIPPVAIAQTNIEGRFHLHGLNFYDTLGVFIQGRTTKGGDNLVIRRDTFSPPAPAFFTLNNASEYYKLSKAYITKMNKWAQSDRAFKVASGDILLKQVDITARREEPDTRRLHSKEFVDATVNLADEKVQFPNVLQYLYKIVGVQVTGSGTNMEVSIRGGREPLFLLDGMPVDLDMIQNINPTDVESIEVLKGANAGIYRSSGQGVIAFYTKRGNSNYDYSKEPAQGAISFKLPGYSRAREFYVPRYDVADARHNLPDHRTTLHWQPTLVTDVEGRAEITFFTSDDVTSFIATCEGMSSSGAVGTNTYTFEVSKRE